VNYLEALESLAEEMGLSPEVCARRFGTLSLDQNTNGWVFHPALGFTRKR
jgi:CRISPR-associated endonuclease/helicase Cas3